MIESPETAGGTGEAGRPRLRVGRRLRPVCLLALLGLVVGAWADPGPVVDGGAASSAAEAVATPSPRVSGVSVEGNRLVDQGGRPVRLVGVNRFGAEYACAQGWGIFDRPADDALSRAIASWPVNSVRILLNEHCWLGVNGVPPQFGGENYRRAIVEWVTRLNRRGLVVLVSLAWSAPGNEPALSQAPMANQDHSPAFWRSVASTFARNRMVMFDLYSEPHDIGWQCWSGGCADGARRYAGMQALVNAVRSTGARQPLIVSGIDYANDLSAWQRYAPDDPASAIVAGFHTYNFTRCSDTECWDDTVGAVAREVPVVAAEFGEDTCRSDYITRFMRWADRRGISYLAWAWVSWEPCTGPALVSNERGTPTPYGAGFLRHLRTLAEGRPR